eukprot:TRINITY_DN4936_c0_g1_i11.p1 TRINITY_DN4936_c0_g1~~TRINITY_DN4936_c0_g1_i11.p1  ORF type:complete len:153 (-),score=31.88 TRINITY_DN4936_c0_g1_i11:343-801(-)
MNFFLQIIQTFETLEDEESSVNSLMKFYHPTNGIYLYKVEKNELNMFPEEEVMLVDCGGTRSQRRKWPYVISEVFYGTYFFFISLTDFFQVLMEDGLTSRIHDTLHLFEAVQQRVNANHNPIVVILSKLDLFVGEFSSVFVFPLWVPLLLFF